MPRYQERQSLLRDSVPRFEKVPSSTHVRNAHAAIDRLSREGSAFWQQGSRELARWQRSCSTLSNFLNRLGERRSIDKQDLATALREFIQEFEHSTGRMFQVLHSRLGATDTHSDFERISSWCELVYRFSSYALIAFWIDDKNEEASMEITINLTHGDTTVNSKTKPMRVPKRHQHATKDI